MDQPLYRTQILLNSEYHQTLASIAAHERRSISDLVSEIVHQNLAERRKKALENGAQSLHADYHYNPELTAFTALIPNHSMDKGEIWLIELEAKTAPASRRLHPAVIINEDGLSNLPLRVVVPLADWKDIYARSPWMVRILPDGGNGLAKVSVADAFQVRSITRERLTHRIGRLNEKVVQEIVQAVGLVVGIK